MNVVIAVVVVVAVAIGLGVWWAVDDAADKSATERGTCGGATWELTTEREDGGTEVSAELQSAGPGEEWQVELTRDDTSLLSGVRTTDEDGEIDVDAFSSGDSGDASYSVTFTPADGEPCTATIGS
ncbi:hypothetical protein [Nocardioides sp. zg-1228]|uniref:hypothetical protein n=1 Tax=Nocardioides sp. zg-1228 TaxID=2763008 RepID=UPI00164311E7|nr:hypothetical protein [Nocardioides sp. zg-1228]MBC2935048.1 hypothetical protein [Nocardioides sp. zg-1228]QSF58995.1 hypothetical protein JX575_07460 [Nocardioides sp. zg-1228]